MKKETFVDKLARKSFESETIQQSWRVHMQAFGPILEPAFAEDYQARVHLTAALNHISRRQIQPGFTKLQKLKDACHCDADHAALLFFFGLCFEFAGDQDNMVSCYMAAGKFGHKFYLPYLKLAKKAHNDGVFDVAEENYRAAIACYDGIEPDAQGKTILASAYTNLAACLTMLHRFAEAEAALQTSEAVLPQQQGRDATKAILYAAMGNAEEANRLVAKIAQELPTLAPSTEKTVSEILDGTHPHFTRASKEHDTHTDVEEIFANGDSSNFVISMIGHLCEKSNYGDNMDALSPAEQVFFICTVLEQEVNNGGFDQFFSNSSGNFANRIIDAFLAIGAEQTARICQDALAAFGKPLPEDWAVREEYLEEAITEEVADILSSCDDRFYEYPEDLETLCYQYALAHKEQFR